MGGGVSLAGGHVSAAGVCGPASGLDGLLLGRLLSLREPPTAVFAELDEVAASVIGALREMRIEVPERMSVLGFDDQPLAEWFDLSTVGPVALGHRPRGRRTG